MKEIYLTKGRVAQVDDEDYWWLMQWRWHAEQARFNCWYAWSKIDAKRVSMHRHLLKDEFNRNPDLETDHIDGNGLNNQRSNLRIVTHSQNQRNRASWERASSQYTGVSREGHRWHAFINHEGTLYTIGRYASEHDAAMARDLVALDLWGEHARMNVLQLSPKCGNPI